MNYNKIVKTAAYIIAGSIGVTAGTAGGYKLVNKIKHKYKIKKGLEDGSIVEIDGQYYEVEDNIISTKIVEEA